MAYYSKQRNKVTTCLIRVHTEALQVPTCKFKSWFLFQKAECLEHSDQTEELSTQKKECRKVAKQSFTEFSICITPLF